MRLNDKKVVEVMAQYVFRAPLQLTDIRQYFPGIAVAPLRPIGHQPTKMYMKR
jgi:hypothetical protein